MHVKQHRLVHFSRDKLSKSKLQREEKQNSKFVSYERQASRVREIKCLSVLLTTHKSRDLLIEIWLLKRWYWNVFSFRPSCYDLIAAYRIEIYSIFKLSNARAQSRAADWEKKNFVSALISRKGFSYLRVMRRLDKISLTFFVSSLCKLWANGSVRVRDCYANELALRSCIADDLSTFETGKNFEASRRKPLSERTSVVISHESIL